MAGFLAFLAIAYVVVAAVLYFMQGALLYPAPRGIPPSTGGFEPVSYETSDGLTLSAGYREARQGFPTLVYFHGNGADWVSSTVATDRLVPEGFGVLAAEYRGYYGNPGSPSEEGLYRDGRAALRFLSERGVEPGAIVLVGNSIGSGVATQLASEADPLALVLISPFASLSELAAEKMRWLPTGLLLRDRYESSTKFANIDAPILILHGTADTLIPVAHARRLAEAREGVELKIVEGAGHDLAWSDEAQAAVSAFLQGLDETRFGVSSNSAPTG